MISGKNIILILKRTLNLVNPQIVDHGERVAYIVTQMLKAQGYCIDEIIDACFLCIMHDIGAFKTEELTLLTSNDFTNGFETENTVKHAVYGYLFIKNFSAIHKHADVVLYHHTAYNRLLTTECQNKALAAKIFVADRLDIAIQNDEIQIDDNLFDNLKGTVFCPSDVDLLIKLEKESNLTKNIKDNSYKSELETIYNRIELTDNQILSFLRTVVYAIDFRSEFTVMHTITAAGLSHVIATLMKLNNMQIEKIFYATLLHDIGKIAIPIEILEKNSALTNEEFAFMKQHIIMSENILRGLVDEEMFNIAVRHHEKLNGKGYPHGLSGSEISISERIVCIADIISALSGKRSYKEPFSEEQIKSILQSMAQSGEIDSDIVILVLKNYSYIVQTVNEQYSWALEKYSKISFEYNRIYNAFLQDSLCE